MKDFSLSKSEKCFSKIGCEIFVPRKTDLESSGDFFQRWISKCCHPIWSFLQIQMCPMLLKLKVDRGFSRVSWVSSNLKNTSKLPQLRASTVSVCRRYFLSFSLSLSRNLYFINNPPSSRSFSSQKLHFSQETQLNSQSQAKLLKPGRSLGGRDG